MTGLLGSPLNVLCKQHAQREFGVGFSTARAYAKSTVEAPASPFPDVMHYIQHGCAIYDSNGALVPDDIDTRAEEIFNKLLEGEYPLKRDGGYECEAPADGKLTKEEMDKIKLPNPKDVYNMDVGEWKRERGRGRETAMARRPIAFGPCAALTSTCVRVFVGVSLFLFRVWFGGCSQGVGHSSEPRRAEAVRLARCQPRVRLRDCPQQTVTRLLGPGRRNGVGRRSRTHQTGIRKNNNKRQTRRVLDAVLRGQASARLCAHWVLFFCFLWILWSNPIRVLLLTNLPLIWTFV